MKERAKFSWKKRLRSFNFAFNGIKLLLKYEHNAWLHLGALFGVVIACILFNVSAIEWCVILLCIGMVFSAEAVNSSIEALADRITVEKDPLIGKAKDLSAAAVLILAIISIGVACFIFIPKF